MVNLKFLVGCLIAILSTSTFSEEVSKAVMEASKEKGIVLSDKAKANIGFKTMRLSGAAPFRVSKTALVYSKDIIGVYMLNGKWIKFVPVKLQKLDASYASIQAEALTANTEIVSEGTALVRVSEMEAFSREE